MAIAPMVALTAVTDFGAKIEHRGLVALAPLSAHGHVAITALPIAKLDPYYAPYVNLKFADGSLDLATDYTTSGAVDGALAPRLDNLTLALGQARIVTPGAKEPLWRLPRLAVNGAAVDLSRRQVFVADASVACATGYVLRNSDGGTQYDKLVKTGAVPAPAARGAAALRRLRGASRRSGSPPPTPRSRSTTVFRRVRWSRESRSSISPSKAPRMHRDEARQWRCAARSIRRARSK
jgi:hypothetical protein